MITVVIPTIGRSTLPDTLAAVGPDVPVIVVDDRRAPSAPLDQVRATRAPSAPPAHVRARRRPLAAPFDQVRVIRSGGRGPAAARNAGWRAAGTPWVVFLDDDVVPGPGWAEAVRKDLVDLPGDVGGSQGRIVVPLPAGCLPTDAERHTAGLAGALWVTADMAYRRATLEAVGGFDERFPRAYREDADLALRVRRAGWRLVRGERVTWHPVRADGFWASVRLQRGNADDALMRHLHGPGWRAAIGGARGRLRAHAVTTAAALMATLLTAASAQSPGRVRHRTATNRIAQALTATSRTTSGRTTTGRTTTARTAQARTAAVPAVLLRRLTGAGSAIRGQQVRGADARMSGRVWRLLPALAVAAGGVWAVLTAEFAWRRIAPGPRTPGEVLRMAVTSVLIPPVACAHRLRGEWRARR